MNQNPEQIARDHIDQLMVASSWIVQDYKKKNVFAAHGVAVREYVTDTGPAGYILFVGGKSVGEVEVKREEEFHRLYRR